MVPAVIACDEADLAGTVG